LSILFAMLAPALAEPLTLDQAKNVLKPGVLEIGLGDADYQANVTEFNDGSKLTDVATIFSLYARYSLSEVVEGSIKVPYLSLSSKSENSTGSATTSDSGLADPSVAFQYLICDCGWESAVRLGISVPMGKQSDKFTQNFRNGFNMKPEFIMSKDFEKYMVNLNLSYDLTGEYEDASAAKTKQNPGDIISLGAGVEYPRWKNTSLTGELVYNSILEASSAGTAVSGTAGSQMDVIVGVRYNKDSLRTKLGLDLSFGDEKFRDYDYKVIAGVTYLLNI